MVDLIEMDSFKKFQSNIAGILQFWNMRSECEWKTCQREKKIFFVDVLGWYFAYLREFFFYGRLLLMNIWRTLDFGVFHFIKKFCIYFLIIFLSKEFKYAETKMEKKNAKSSIWLWLQFFILLFFKYTLFRLHVYITTMECSRLCQTSIFFMKYFSLYFLHLCHM